MTRYIEPGTRRFYWVPSTTAEGDWTDISGHVDTLGWEIEPYWPDAYTWDADDLEDDPA